MSIDWNLFLGTTSTIAIVAGIVAWVLKSVIQQGLLRDLETHKANLRNQVDSAIEGLRIHDKDRADAHKRLFAFAKRVRNETFPMAEDKQGGFRRVMSSDYWGKLQLDQVYFSDQAAKILDHFEEMCVCMNRHELAADTSDEVERFLDKEAFAQSEKLSIYARGAMHALRTGVQ